jgi:hypothetical protein
MIEMSLCFLFLTYQATVTGVDLALCSTSEMHQTPSWFHVL